jgi:hypothetical protein
MAFVLDTLEYEVEAVLCIFSDLLAPPNLDSLLPKLDSLGSLVKEKAFALHNISKKRNSLRASFRVIVFIG